MFRRLVPLLALAAVAAGSAQPALGTTAASCTVHTSKLRYRPEYTAACNFAITAVELVRASDGKDAAVTPTFPDPTDVTVDANGTLSSGKTYRLKLTVDDGVNGPALVITAFKTLAAPAHAGLHVKYITAIPADAVLDIAHRMDSANLFAVPTAGDFIDASTQGLSTTAYTDALRHYQSALVVTDLPVLSSGNLGSALNAFCNHGHGVVLAGQTHWTAGGAGWNQPSAIGAPGGPWEKHWSLYYYEDMPADRVIGGDLASGSVKPHFLTKGLKSFHVYGYGSGAVELRDYAQGKVLAHLKPNAPFYNTYGGQFFLSEHQIGAGRTVDLGFRPWSKDISSGGFDPADGSPGGPLTARALWWATDRIPPYDTHFSSKPPSTSTRATVIVQMAAKDSDAENSFDLHFRYRVDGGRWKQAVGTSFVLYHLATGRRHTIQARAVDIGGNTDPKAATYSFYVTPGAIG